MEELESIERQIAELQAQRREQIKASKQQEELSPVEQAVQRMQHRNESQVARTQESWPSGAVILEGLLSKSLELYQVTQEAKVLASQANKLRKEISKNGQPYGLQQKRLGELEEEVTQAYQRKRELEEAIRADRTLKQAFATDHHKQLESIRKLLEKAADEINDLAEVEKSLAYHPHRGHTPLPKLAKLSREASSVLETIRKY